MNNIKNYHPLYFLSALGNGGLAVSFFMYFMFLIKHPDTPIPNFSHLKDVVINGGLPAILAIVVAAIIILLAFNHYRLLIQNIKHLNRFKKTQAYQTLQQSPGGVTFIAAPLTYAMSINVAFILGALFVPGLWDIVEYLFPFAMIGFFAVGIYAIKIYLTFLKQFFTNGQFNLDAINHYGQMLGAFAFIMVAVGLASPAAMSHTTWVSAISAVGSFIFILLAVAVFLLFFGQSTRAILRNGFAKANAPTIWIGIPILTLAGITFIRLYSMVSHQILGKEITPALAFTVLGLLFAGNIVIGIIGYTVMKKMNYFKEQPDPSSTFGLICPGVAFFVLGMFFIHWGLVKTDIVTAYSYVHYTLIGLLAITQLKTVQWIFKLSRKYL